MTTVAACIRDGVGAIGADRAIHYGGERADLAEPKLARLAPWLIVGLSGEWAARAWMDDVEVPDTIETVDDARRALRSLAHDLRAWCKERDVQTANVVGLTPWGACALSANGDAAILGATHQAGGSGGEFAIGAMSALQSSDLDARGLVAAALEVATRHDASTGGDVDIWTMDMALVLSDAPDTDPP